MGAYPELNVMRGTADTNILSWNEIPERTWNRMRRAELPSLRVELHASLAQFRAKPYVLLRYSVFATSLFPGLLWSSLTYPAWFRLTSFFCMGGEWKTFTLHGYCD